jgi:L-aspartate oxidase
VAQLSGGNLAPRDQVSRALARHIRTAGVEHVWLDLRPVGEERLRSQFPTILGRCRALGLEPTREPLPVAPAAHYWMGGVATDLQAATSVPGLYAVGEVACTGVHGANRLASNSLMECLVFARQLRHLRLSASPGAAATEGAQPHPRQRLCAAPPQRGQLQQRIGQLRDLCWQVAGVERQGHSLAPALRQVRRQRQELEADPIWRQAQQLAEAERIDLGPEEAEGFAALHEFQQRLCLAELLIDAALFRRESRGGHFRTDAPASQPFWQRHSSQQRGRGISTTALRPGLDQQRQTPSD